MRRTATAANGASGKCPYCHRAVEEDARFCVHCVSSLRDPFELRQRPAVDRAPPARTWVWALGFVIINGVAFAICRFALDMVGMMCFFTPILGVVFAAAMYGAYRDGRDEREIRALARRMQLSLERGRVSAPERVEGFAAVRQLREAARREAQPVITHDLLRRRTACEELAAFGLTRQVEDSEGEVWPQWRPVAAILRADLRFPRTEIEPVRKREWPFGRRPEAVEEEFRRRFTVQSEDPGFADRLLTATLKAALLQAKDCGAELGPEGVLVMPAHDRAYPALRRHPPAAGYRPVLLLARTVLEEAREALVQTP